MTATARDLPASIADLLPRVHVLRLPMITRFRGITEREVMLLEGPAGWAEFSPFLEYGPLESSRWLQAALEFAGLLPPESGQDRPLPGQARPGSTSTAPTPASTEPGRPTARTSVPVNATLPARPVAEVESILARFGAVGTVKAKVAENGIASLPEDLARLRELRRLRPDVELRLDANAKYTLAEALDAAEAFAGFGLQYFEQPVPGVEDLARLREELAARGLPVRLAADESIRKAEDPLRVAGLGAAEVVIVKVQPLGGVAAARRIVAESGLPAVVSSALESSVGLAAGAQLAASLPVTAASREVLGEMPACGLGTARLFAEDVVADGLVPTDGRIPVTRIAPDPQRLRALDAGPGRSEWWLRRAQACWDVLRSPTE
ncbi:MULTISPECIES: o-succinylbenzoate synthase [Brevibacterium]|uniref:o-succinylbenzoate synthase n=2 Tax=Brevibacterium TaxID=1696 RepID=A0A269Z6S2_9MICO|nr:o-succinylbenzoate synthase [Brevibacterium casei]NJE65504.1 O-succinylbenzoate synthase [Brevibacterium sp. LS14]MCT1446113.1 o-succinylbenzoate synthase [Brevibacterium casei]MCT1549253.1 o-succinylbenzoate synthase [Brevibacterium casei]MCT1560772.1 o-succinylbenzoate synthase [Brevibacterium casei]MCT1767054.1 o-succinylbenzoate synthase [Brevibacterium casei]